MDLKLRPIIGTPLIFTNFRDDRPQQFTVVITRQLYLEMLGQQFVSSKILSLIAAFSTLIRKLIHRFPKECVGTLGNVFCDVR